MAPGVHGGRPIDEKFAGRGRPAAKIPTSPVVSPDDKDDPSRKLSQSEWDARNRAAFEARVAAARTSLALRRHLNREPSANATDNVFFFE
jgi:hypothetical protein